VTNPPAPRQALLVMDFQQSVVDRVPRADVLDAAARAVAAAHAHRVPVIFVRVAFRHGYPEVSPTNRTFSALADAGARFTDDDPGTQLHPALSPAEGDLVVVKKRVSAFTGSDLEVVLRSRGITSLVLAGIATSGVVLSTLREAADRDYQLTVLSDACTDADDEVHRVLLGKVFPRQADVLTATDWIARLGETRTATS
jgi:nicotinamidase-related amidase